MTEQPILVLGATGKTGRRIVERLSEQGYKVRRGSRQADPPFDWERPETWAAVLRGVKAVYISYVPDLSAPGATVAIQELTSRAVDAGVERLVLLSGRGEEEPAQRCEGFVQECGVSSTLIRSSWFAQNFSEGFLLDAIKSGTVAMPVGNVLEPFIDVGDIADVAVAALTEDGHEGRLYEVTGPRLLTFADAVHEIAAAAGRPVEYVQLTPEQYAERLTQDGVPEEAISLLLYVFATVLDGRNSSLADGVQQVLHKEPRDFADFARETAATGIWTVQSPTTATS